MTCVKLNNLLLRRFHGRHTRERFSCVENGECRRRIDKETVCYTNTNLFAGLEYLSTLFIRRGFDHHIWPICHSNEQSPNGGPHALHNFPADNILTYSGYSNFARYKKIVFITGNGII